MDKFESVKQCVKCHGNVYTNISKTFTGTRRYVPRRFSFRKLKFVPEHLIVVCRDCGYGWTEECADGN